MAASEYLSVELVEKDVIRVDFTEKEIINVEFKSIDVLDYHEKEIVSNIVKEIPTKLTVRRFQTSEEYVPSSLSVFFNGLKERYITEVTSTTFDMPIDTIVNDTIEVEYIEIN